MRRAVGLTRFAALTLLVPCLLPGNHVVSLRESHDHVRVSALPPEAADVPHPQVVTQLLREQAPHLADMPVQASHASGSSNWVFRVGDALAVRLPRSDDYVADLAKEVRWLPRLAPHLPVPVPDVVAVGQPSTTFPRPWAVVSWVPGELPLTLDGSQQELLAASLGGFLKSPHAVDTTDVPAGPEHWGYRCGEPVTETIDRWADHAAAALSDLFAPTGVREAWRRLRDVPAATQAACWVHTDLSEENLLARHDGHLAGVIDFGGVGVGDRSVDLLYAWSIFDAPARELLRRASGADDETWARARAWAFVGPGLLTISNYRHTMPSRAERLTSMVETIAAEVDIELR
ncbi:aminoglycoside phosphotransferase family protein [Cellulomonas chengniuliangii]|uniref:aminoglycoside phosphotransferase family protein n=1 Tax=Cellulomonas chengniuliangii TaxID=2968084 RepID=UPI001D0F3404|nr:aminoglycoside phosphotransferase family protein [Cellulomonas chengniuliangii]